MFEHVIGEAVRTPWALTPSYLAIMQRVLSARAQGGRPIADDLAMVRATRETADAQRRSEVRRIVQRLGAEVVALDDDDDDEAPASRRMVVLRAASGGASARGTSIAIIPMYGAIMHRSFEAMSGATSCEVISAMVQRATDDDDVGGILLDAATPGGSVVGVPDLADQILAARKEKPVTALVNGEMHSAGYWLGSQASEIVAIPSGYLGSIGVWMLTEDWSEYLANEGIKINFIYSGENKIEEGRFWEPLSDEARAHLQADCDRIYAQFLAAVAKGRTSGDRRVSVADVKKNYGQGRVFNAREALQRGMIDRLGSMEDVVGSMLKAASRRQTLSAGARPAAPVASDEPPRPVAEEPVALPESADVPSEEVSAAQIQADLDAAEAAVRIAERL